MRRCLLVLALVLSFVTISLPAYAYFDPNASSLLSQILAPLTAAIASIWLLGVGKISTLISTIRRKLAFGAKHTAVEHETNAQTVKRSADPD